MFSRQLALLLGSGTDIVTSLELLQNQVANRTLKKSIGEIASDLRGGSSLSKAVSKHPRVFSKVYHRAIAAGEHGGDLEVVLKRMADHMERAARTEKSVKSALMYPIIVAIVAVVVIAIMVTVVLPSFAGLYASFGVELPIMTRMLISFTEWIMEYGLYLLTLMVAAVVLGTAYVRTRVGRYHFDRLLLRLPVIGRINLLNELSRYCRTIALLFKVGLPLPEILSLASQGTNNRIMADALSEVRMEMIKGEGLSRPMARRSVFLPLMVQMVGVGEQTGNLDDALTTVAESYEMESDDRTSAAVGLIQPVMTVGIGVVIAIIAVSMLSAMYSIYGQVGF